MHIKALRSNFGDNGAIRKGQVVNVSEDKARQLIRRGIFAPVATAPAKPPAFSPQVLPRPKPATSKPPKVNAR
ncbi:hypothetical protein LAV84_06890 [Rhizobium sp. VS19-DR104.2]|uniref:hypothetical protein n=1 Tax=unclassified Rhizobium TaxID=2613769 RepID=UPI001CC6E04A|nr:MULTISPECIES: hypothetical protein [unclassified Rhizobium]MBZ5760273.1 hypothetical protein [Rhizobium sp. VS19-DR96]MBZ5766883.1 hypothetical protein [Rhizobium sp. VS19-DR129.2]MBZ5773124.1 hypothetical protein [Rhizobium sp. VS19-DRK62.2]MBZ5784108.1 hypothetical protein [Rhizobium sp. VS19-DR121]MBZ5802468.1 hypothetical protein [Rhizobium sp. VS19-DR181]